MFCLALAAASGRLGGQDEDNIEANIFWSETEGATSYDIYRAPSRFGSYKLIASGITDTWYNDPDYKATNYYNILPRKGSVIMSGRLYSAEIELFGEDTFVISPEDKPADVQKAIDRAYSEQEEAHFGSSRYAFLFKPGEYSGDIKLKAGYYTTFAGLGVTPDEVSIQGAECTDTWSGSALINFWRGMENLSLRSDLLWGVSQGCYLRGIHVQGGANLWHTGASSGGFMANSQFSGTVNSGSQQQWFARNSGWGGWQGSLWNMVFVGNEEGCSPTLGWQQGASNTVVESTPVIREKPYLIWQNGEYSVFVPSLRTDASGLYDPSSDADARIIPLEDFFIAGEGTTAAEINAQLANGKNLLFTPGIYELEEPIKVNNDETVVLGLGMATLVPANGEGCMITDGANVTVAGLLFDAKNSQYLLKVCGNGGADKILIADCFFRVGGVTSAKTNADTCLLIEADDVITDNTWTWRADHGYRWRESTDSSAGVGWNVNTARTGVAVYGDNVTAYGLFSEHFLGHNVYWAGNGGAVYFFQSEVAYDIPAGGDGGTAAQISFYVEDGVTSFSGTAFGVYTHFLNDGVTLDCAVRVPENDGVTLTNVVAIALSSGNTSHLNNVVNNYGGFVGKGSTQVRVYSYPAEQQ